MPRKIYLASSWRNVYQPEVVRALRQNNHLVYDFRNPTVDFPNPNQDAHGFHWSDIDSEWQSWSPAQYRQALNHPLAKQGYASDKGALDWADTCVLVLPSGRSAHLEAGWCAGMGKPMFIYMPEQNEPELMNSLADKICINMSELILVCK